jgi:hypothetical protein
MAFSKVGERKPIGQIKKLKNSNLKQTRNEVSPEVVHPLPCGTAVFSPVGTVSRSWATSLNESQEKHSSKQTIYIYIK